MGWFSKKITLDQIQSDNQPIIACTDLGAFNSIGKNKLKGIDAVVIMEDRLPEFFLGFADYSPQLNTGLNRHGPFKKLKTFKHLKQLVEELHDQDIDVFIGFWGQVSDPHNSHSSKWLEHHPELWRLNHENKENHDMDPLVRLSFENVPMANYIVNQFKRLKYDFKFDGLFLGDGLNGYRYFKDPTKMQDQQASAPKWNEFYMQICQGLHNLDSYVLAYDCMGFDPERALKHGADYVSQANAGLDYLIVQTYPTAWGQKWLKDFQGFDFESCKKNLTQTFNALKNTNCSVYYTLEIGDSVENWSADRESQIKQLQEFKNISKGKVLIWANRLFHRMLK